MFTLYIEDIVDLLKKMLDTDQFLRASLGK